jgi:hypothetical protein
VGGLRVAGAQKKKPVFFKLLEAATTSLTEELCPIHVIHVTILSLTLYFVRFIDESNDDCSDSGVKTSKQGFRYFWTPSQAAWTNSRFKLDRFVNMKEFGP